MRIGGGIDGVGDILDFADTFAILDLWIYGQLSSEGSNIEYPLPYDTIEKS